MRTIPVLRLVAPAVLALSACAPAPSPELAPATRDGTVLVEGDAITIRTSERPVTASAPVSLEQAWAVLPAAYEAVGLRGATVGEWRFATPRTEVFRALGGARLSRYLDCGATVSVPNADSYAVTLQVTTRLARVTDDTTRVETLVQATARPRDTAGSRVTCTSTGVLERQLAGRLGPAAS